MDIQAVILAGGKGTRLRPVTTDLPKPLVPVANRPLISHQLAHLAASGIRDVTLALGYNADRFVGVSEEADALGLRLQLVTEPYPLGTGGALRYCADQGAFDERPLLWMNGDVVVAPDLAALADLHAAREADLTLWLTSTRHVSEFGVLELDADGRVQRFLEKPAAGETDSHLVNAGIVMLDPVVLQRLPADTEFSFEQGLLPEMVAGDDAVYAVFDGTYWLDTGRPHLLLAANRHVMEGRLGWSPRGTQTGERLWEGQGVKRSGVHVTQPAAFGDDVLLESGAKFFGGTALGDRTRVRSGARLESCVLLDDVEIAPGAEVVNSIVCSGALVGEDVVLHNSVVGARSIVGARNQLLGTRIWNDVTVGDEQVFVDQ